MSFTSSRTPELAFDNTKGATAPAEDLQPEAQASQGQVPAEKSTDLVPGTDVVPLTGKPRRGTRSQYELDLFELSMDMQEREARESGNLGFVTSFMALCSLPHSKVEGGSYKRTNGYLSLLVTNDPEVGIPYGKLPRQLLVGLCSEAVRTKKKKLFLGRSQREFLIKLGLHPGGGETGSYKRYADQSFRLFTSTVQVNRQREGAMAFNKMSVADAGVIFWDPLDPTKESKWQSELELSDKFFDECIQHGMPVDLRVIRELQSSLAIDLYLWLKYRNNAIKVPTPIQWPQLMFQMGSGYPETPQGIIDFRKAVVKHMKRLQLIMDVNVKLDKDAFLLLPPKK